MTKILPLLMTVNGSSFLGLDTETTVPLKGGKKNPMQGRVTKKVIGSSVMAFANKNINGYDAMVKRRLEAEGKDPASFELSPRAWGTRVPNLPLVQHEKVDSISYYMEVIFLKAGTSEYFLDGNPIAKSDIEGLQEIKEGEQASLENKVIIRTFSLSSITKLRINHEEHEGPFEL